MQYYKGIWRSKALCYDPLMLGWVGVSMLQQEFPVLYMNWSNSPISRPGETDTQASFDLCAPCPWFSVTRTVGQCWGSGITLCSISCINWPNSPISRPVETDTQARSNPIYNYKGFASALFRNPWTMFRAKKHTLSPINHAWACGPQSHQETPRASGIRTLPRPVGSLASNALCFIGWLRRGTLQFVEDVSEMFYQLGIIS